MMRTFFNMRVSTNVNMRIRVHAFFLIRTFLVYLIFMTNREYFSIPLTNMIYHLYFVFFLSLCHSLILFLSLSLSLLNFFHFLSLSLSVSLSVSVSLTLYMLLLHSLSNTQIIQITRMH